MWPATRAGLTRLSTGRPPGGPVSAMAAIVAVIAKAFKFTINCHVYIKYFGQKHEHLLPLIFRFYNHTFHSKVCTLIHMHTPVAVWTNFKRNQCIYLFLHLPPLIFFLSLDT